MKQFSKQAQHLNKTIALASQNSSTTETEELLVRFSIFQLDCALSLSVLNECKPVGFARKQVLAKLAHCLYEFDDTFNHHMKRVILKVADEKESMLTGKNLKLIKKKYPGINNITKFHDIRNKLSAHYDKNFSTLFSSAEELTETEVLVAHDDSAKFYKEIIEVLIGNKSPPST
jgi:hypothetical protein